MAAVVGLVVGVGEVVVRRIGEVVKVVGLVKMVGVMREVGVEMVVIVVVIVMGGKLGVHMVSSTVAVLIYCSLLHGKERLKMRCHIALYFILKHFETECVLVVELNTKHFQGTDVHAYPSKAKNNQACTHVIPAN